VYEKANETKKLK